MIHLTIKGVPVKMELDTGAAVSVISDQHWKMFGKTVVLEPYKRKQLQGYSEHEVKVVGQAQVDVGYGHQRHQPTLLLVAGNQRPPLFGRNWL